MPLGAIAIAGELSLLFYAAIVKVHVHMDPNRLVVGSKPYPVCMCLATAHARPDTPSPRFEDTIFP
jgi:hypothetical protein